MPFSLTVCIGEVVWQRDALQLNISFFITEHKQGAAILNKLFACPQSLFTSQKNLLLNQLSKVSPNIFISIPVSSALK